jgi:hypothetical protein
MTPFWIQFFTAFKKHFFGIEDKFSFERAFYIKDLHGQMVRLQNIRFEYPDPNECIAKLKEGIDEECKKI